MDLFLTNKIAAEKIASVELEENPASWPRQVLTELFRTMPEISDYVPEVSFLRMDEEQGYALGVVTVSNVTNSALSVEGAGSTPRKAFIPVVIASHALKPMDIVVSPGGKMFPLTPERLREVLYRPEGFDLVTQDSGDASIWGMFQPPGRSDSSFASGFAGISNQGPQTIMGPGMKMAGARFAMLEAIGSSILQPDLDALTIRVDSTPELLKAASSSSSFLGALQQLSTVQGVTKSAADAREAALDSLYPADVVQLGCTDGTYWYKTANRAGFRTHERTMARGEFLKFAGAEITKRVDTEGTVTVSDPVVVAGPRGGVPKVVDGAGPYTVYAAHSAKELQGHVFPELIDTSGARLPIAVFIGAAGHATQDQIVGSSNYNSGLDLPLDPAKGTGIFYTWSDGNLIATVPVTVKGAHRLGDKDLSYDCVDFTGAQMKITLSEGTKSIVAFPGAKELVMPFDTHFAALRGPELQLLSQGDLSMATKRTLQGATSKSAAALHGAALVRYDDDCYGLKIPGTKLAHLVGTGPVNQDHAMFVLCCGGLGTKEAMAALTAADRTGSWHGDLQDFGAGSDGTAAKTAGALVAEVHGLRRDLLKEATQLPDVMTVDSVLSLGFINTENIRTFVERIPYLERALSLLCELVLASRIGLVEIPEGAAGRCVRGLNDVVVGLKGLALREIRDVS